MRGMRTLTTSASHDVQVRLERPRVSVVSTHHYINHGGTEFVVYRATPEDVESGVVVGDVEYPGLSRPRARPSTASRSPTRRCASRSSRCSTTRTSTRRCASSRATRPATPRAPTSTTARSRSRSRRAGFRSTTSSSTASCRRSSKARPRSSPTATTSRSSSSSTASCGGRTPRRSRASPSRPRPRCCGTASCSTPFKNNAVESAFADHRTYIYKGKDVDQQVHLGFDLASLRRHADRRRQSRQGALRRRARHLRQLRHRRPRHGRAVALRAPLVDRRQGGTGRREGADARPQRHDRARRRRSPALHDARQRAAW